MIERITVDPNICHGQACIRGIRIPVSLILELLSVGEPVEHILTAYSHIQREDIYACLAYAAALAREETVELPA